MNSSYDRWLTTPPVDPLDTWDEIILDRVSEEFFELEQDRFLVSDTYWKWLAKVSEKASPYTEGERGEPIKNNNALTDEQCAALIERAYNIFIKGKQNIKE